MADLRVGADKIYSTIQSALNAAASGDRIIIDVGTYNEALMTVNNGVTLLADDIGVIVSPLSGYALTQASGKGILGYGITFHGRVSPGATNIYLEDCEITQLGASSYVFPCSGPSNVLRRCKIRSGSIGIYVQGGKTSIYETEVYGNASQGILTANAGIIEVFEKAIIHHNAGPGISIGGTGTSHQVIQSIISKNGLQAIITSGTTVCDVENSVMLSNCSTGGAVGAVYVHSSTSTINLKNSIISGTVNAPGLYNDSGGVLNYGNNIIIGNGNIPSANITLNSGANDLGGNITSTSDKIGLECESSLSGYFALNFDDGTVGDESTWWNSLSDALAPFGAKCTFYPTLSLCSLSDIQSLVNAGHEVGVHTWSHTALSSDNAFTISTTNASPTISIDHEHGLFLLTCSDPIRDISMPLDSMLSDLKIAVSGKGWTIVNGANVTDQLQLSSLSTLSSVTFPVTPTLDKIAPHYRFYANEIANTAQFLAENTGQSMDVLKRSFAYPYGDYDGTAVAYIKSIWGGFCARGAGTSTSRQLKSINIYGLSIYARSDILAAMGATEESCRACATRLYYYTKFSNSHMIIMSHQVGGPTIDQWVWFVDQIQKLGGQFSTISEITTGIIADHQTTDGITYTKEYSADIDLTSISGSLLRGSGGDVGLIVDPDGSPIPGTFGYDIGLYNYYKQTSEGFGEWKPFDGTMPDFDFSSSSPGYIKEIKYR